MIRVFTAFSGYDSQCMALDRLHRHNPDFTYELVGWAEIDKYAIAAHNAVYPQWAERNYGDISKIDWAQVPDFDLFTYSSPCQDFSIAGKQHGGEKGSGTRSSLLWECERAIAYKRPKYLLFENVSALVSNKFIRLFNDWQLTLERLGYTNFTQVLNAKDYGVPQNRERVFMVSVLNCDKPFYFPETMPLKKCLRDVLEDNVGEDYYLSGRVVQMFNKHAERYKYKGFSWRPTDGSGIGNAVVCTSSRSNSNYIIVHGRINRGASGRIFNIAGISPTLTASEGVKHNTMIIQRNHGYNKGGYKHISPSLTGSSYTDNNVLYTDDSVRKLTPTECFRLMGVSDEDSKKICTAVSKTQAYKLAGNSIVVDVIALIFRQLLIGNTNKNQQLEII